MGAARGVESWRCLLEPGHYRVVFGLPHPLAMYAFLKISRNMLADLEPKTSFPREGTHEDGPI